MELDQYNPIRSVDGQYLKCPSSYQWRLQDISASDAGRTEDNKMDKKRLGQCVKLELEWKYTTIKEAAAILKAEHHVAVVQLRQANAIAALPQRRTVTALQVGTAHRERQPIDHEVGFQLHAL